MSSLILRKAKLTDAAYIVEIYLSAFISDAISLLVFPRSTPTTYNFWYDMIIAELTHPHAHFYVVTTSTQDEPDYPVAFAKWEDTTAPLPTTDLPEWPEGADTEIANQFFGSLFKRHAEIMKDKKHWYLELLATRPEYQGKGAAGKLLRWGIEKVDEEGVEAYLEASPDGKPIYEYLGFEEVDRLVVELEGKGEAALGEKEFVECFMVRKRKGKS
ncbi:acetyltransferase-like protein [Tricladium varicosporioides]|nr:acetyltransferase-like protein [Hymenoscyphus varicosporioides]